MCMCVYGFVCCACTLAAALIWVLYTFILHFGIEYIVLKISAKKNQRWFCNKKIILYLMVTTQGTPKLYKMFFFSFQQHAEKNKQNEII